MQPVVDEINKVLEEVDADLGKRIFHKNTLSYHRQNQLHVVVYNDAPTTTVFLSKLLQHSIRIAHVSYYNGSAHITITDTGHLDDELPKLLKRIRDKKLI